MTMPSPRCPALLAIAAACLLFSTCISDAAQDADAAGSAHVERTISTPHALPGSTFRVCLEAKAREDLDGVGVHETLPLGWTLTALETDGVELERVKNEWVLPERLREGTRIELAYDVTVPHAEGLYSEPLPACFEISGIFQSTVPGFEISIPGDAKVEIVTELPILTAIAHLVRDTGADRIDLRLDKRISAWQLDRALWYWATDTAVPGTGGQCIDLAMMEKITAYHETCTEIDDSLPLSLDPELLAIRTIETFLPCDSVVLPGADGDPGLPARQLSITVEISAADRAYGIGLNEWFPSTWRVTPVEHPGFVFRPSANEWIYPDLLRPGQTLTVQYIVEVIESAPEQIDPTAGCCGNDALISGIVSSGLACSAADVGGESAVFVWECLPVLLAISRWNVAEDRFDATLSDTISYPQMRRAMGFWANSEPVPHTCGYTVGYHMLKRIIAYWLAELPVTNPLPGSVAEPCSPDDNCYTPLCPAGGLCAMVELQRVEDFVGGPKPVSGE